MRALLPVVFVAGFVVVMRFVWGGVFDAITKATADPPLLPAQKLPVTPRLPAAEEETFEDDRVFEPDAVVRPPAKPRGRNQYADPFAARPPRVHPAERVKTAPPPNEP